MQPTLFGESRHAPAAPGGRNDGLMVNQNGKLDGGSPRGLGGLGNFSVLLAQNFSFSYSLAGEMTRGAGSTDACQTFFWLLPVTLLISPRALRL